MAAIFLTQLLIAAAVLLPSAVVLSSFPATLTLERAFPTNHKVELSHLRARDRVRHGRMLQQSPGGGVVNFPIGGTFNPYLVGLYFTSVKLGTPATEYYVQIDTGSDILWVACNSCNGCPKSTGLKLQLKTFDPKSSNSASVVTCSDKICSGGLQQTQDSSCDTQHNQCTYAFQYGDGSGTSGYYVSDLLQLDTVGGDQSSNSSANIVFGCSTSATGILKKTDRAVDGIFGFGQQEFSVISQLSSQGIAPKVFSHCLKGDDTGGGILVLGEIVEPGIVYSPLVADQPHYNLNLESITVKGQKLAIDPSVFATSSNQGTIVDSGTTLAYFAQDAYNPFVDAITNAVSQFATPVTSQGDQCYIVTSSISDTFPQVSLNFAGNASMILRPEDYLLQQDSASGAVEWCIGIQKSDGQELTVLGDLVLKDKIIVYDLAKQRIGWTQYDCSKSVSVSVNTSTGTESVNAGLINTTSSQSESFKPMPISLMAFILHISIIAIIPFS